MNWLDKLEYKYRRYGIPNLMKIVVFGQLIVWLTVMLLDSRVYSLLTLTRSGLMHLQLWRAVSFIFVPTLTTNPLLLALELYLYYMIGSSLEQHWGTFRFNVYYLVGMLGAVASCLITGYAGNSALNLSLFFAFAILYPEMQFLLFFIIPIKVKWLGLLAGAMYLLDFLTGSLGMKVSLLFGLANFLLFFGPEVKKDYDNYKRRKAWQDQWKN